MQNVSKKLCAILLIAVLCAGVFSGCSGGEPSPSPAPATNAPITEPPATEPPEQTVYGIYEKKLAEPISDATSFLMEILEKDDSLFFRAIMVYPYGRAVLPAYSAKLNKGGSGFYAVCDDEYEHIELSLSGGELTVDYNTNGDHDEGLSGLYLPYDEPVSEYPAIPPLETDPLSPGGSIERHLSEAARKVLGLGENEVLTEELCKKVERLELYRTEITSLQGIEYFTNLKCIYTFGGYISDLSPLKNMTSLEDITIQHCLVEELPDLSALENLLYLQVTDGLITDPSPAASLKGLSILDLSYNYITSIAPLIGLEGAERVVLNFNPILDWECVPEDSDLARALDWDIADALAVNERARQILEETIEPGMTDLEKQIAICTKIHEIADTDEKSRPMRPDGYEVLINGGGVCSDFSGAITLLLRMAGLNAISCSSEEHSWNMIELDGQWYEFDCYWDDNKPIDDWNFFDLSHAEMSKVGSHTLMNPLRYPLCEHSMNTLSYVVGH